MIFSLFLVACSTSVPHSFELKNDRAEVVGHAFQIESGVGVTADHIWQEHKPLLYQNRKITVIERDASLDLLYFELNDLPPVALRTTKLLEGETLYWGNKSGLVNARQARIELGNPLRLYTNLIVLFGETKPGESGLPVYDKNNQVVGLIVGGASSLVYVRPL